MLPAISLCKREHQRNTLWPQGRGGSCSRHQCSPFICTQAVRHRVHFTRQGPAAPPQTARADSWSGGAGFKSPPSERRENKPVCSQAASLTGLSSAGGLVTNQPLIPRNALETHEIFESQASWHSCLARGALTLNSSTSPPPSCQPLRSSWTHTWLFSCRPTWLTSEMDAF